MEKFNQLLAVIKQSLMEMDLAMKGFSVMGSALESMHLKIQNNQVPDDWSAAAYPSLKSLSSWYKDLIERVKFMNNWMKRGNPNSYWMSGMFFPHGFMTAVLQTHARYYKIAFDNVAFTFEI